MTLLVSIDPGVAAGVAVWEDRELASAWLVQSTGAAEFVDHSKTIIATLRYRFGAALEGARLICEVPQIYHQSKQKGDQNDLIYLTLLVGAIAVRFAPIGEVTLVTPFDWKKNTPKEVMTKRTQAVLSPAEQARIELPRATKIQHNVWDAVGIGYYHLKKGNKR